MSDPTKRADPIPVFGRRNGLRSVARPIAGYDGNADANWAVLSRERLLGGPQQVSTPDPCNLPPGFVALPGVWNAGSVEIKTTRLHAVAGCDGLPDTAKYTARARALLEANTDAQLETALSARLAALPSNPNLVTGPLGTAPATDVDGGIGVAVNALRWAVGYGGPVTFLLPEWCQAKVMRNAGFERVGDTLRLGDNLVLFGAGITGAGPVGATGPGAGQFYLWAVAGIEYALHPTVKVTEDDDGGLRNNQTIRAQRLAYVDVETVAARAVLVGVN